MEKKVVIIGSSGHAKVVIDIFEASKSHQIIGLLDSYRQKGEKTLSYEILGDENVINELIQIHKNLEFFIAIGDNWARNEFKNKIITIHKNIKFATAIHPSATISQHVKIGSGTCIMPGAIVNTNCNIGEFCILNTNSSLDHDCIMKHSSSLAPKVCTGGYVEIEEYSAISIGAIIKDRIKIGKHTVIGAGSLVLKDCEPMSIYYGLPAKKIRHRKVGEKYL